jgi:catechol 2,3-dioxygenase-like lactoylglutathione lyase family enzyme
LEPEVGTDETVHVRYMVDDVAAAADFYTTHLGFKELSSALPAFADVSRGNLRLLLSGPASSAGRVMPDGARPGPGGWNESTSSPPTSPAMSPVSKQPE